MRVIAGRAKGHQLKGPAGPLTRPTSDKVRGAIFAMLESLLEEARGPAREEASLWEGQRVLDLYAGTGALGIEALSRGASCADFVELNPAACRVIRENLAHTKLAPDGRVHCIAVPRFIRQCSAAVAQGEGEGYDLVLMDPPYGEAGLEDLLVALGSGPLVKEAGWLVVEHGRRRSLPAVVAALMRVRARRHGDTEISIYRRRCPGETAVVTPGDGPGYE